MEHSDYPPGTAVHDDCWYGYTVSDEQVREWNPTNSLTAGYWCLLKAHRADWSDSYKEWTLLYISPDNLPKWSKGWPKGAL